MSAGHDPFIQVQEDVLATLETVKPLFASYLRIRSIASSASTPELVQTRQELESHLQNLTADLQDLVDSIRAAEKDPYRYGLDLDEVSRRSRLVKDVGAEIDDIRRELTQVIGIAAGKQGLPDPSAFDREDDDDYAAFEQRQQVKMMQEQDEVLDDIFTTVDHLRLQAGEMGRELEEQAEIIEEVETVTDRVGDKLTGGMTRLNTIIRQNEDRLSSCCIGVLILVLVILLILIIAL